MKNIIFIEGVSGVGKSTTARKLGEKLRSAGYAVECHFEGDADNPLALCHVAYLELGECDNVLAAHPDCAGRILQNSIRMDDCVLVRYRAGGVPLYPLELQEKLQSREFAYAPEKAVVPLARFTQIYETLWSGFAARDHAQCDYAIFDAALVSLMSSDLIRNYGASADEVARHLEALVRAVRQMNPIVFYLSTEDVRTRLISARQSRKQVPYGEDKLAFWERRKQMDLSVLPRLSTKWRILDVENDGWDAAVDGILAQFFFN